MKEIKIKIRIRRRRRKRGQGLCPFQVEWLSAKGIFTSIQFMT
jgi:hypothetical protein